MTQIISNLNKTALVVDHPIGQDNPPLLSPDSHNDDPNAPTQKMLQLSDFAVNWENRLTDEQLDTFVTDGWLTIDNVFNKTALLALQAESGFIDYRDAALTAGIRISDIRGDRIRWITENFFAGYYYLQSINALAALFNRSLFAGIRHSEAHYACYPIGFGYQWHSDNPAGRDERVISAVFYLNDDWEATDGGALEVVDKHGTHHEVMPVANRLIIFDSDLQHQVQIAHRQRYSIATWMRRDGLVPFVEVDA
ncbi:MULTISPECIES: 2OG-Fe(II) oxygenase [Psychrobacter]|jgi:SM-20-related protein|uniref:2OG-Fe(II) oxygenase n=1 Tax=Psychrobacter TaxID=497 RepID=UPI001BAF74BC|nr:2OG-Fe(II) oxygenase [Psychrobacter sp. UBA2514]|tara:strand:+ start:645 stop:1400 length:756 start_codon:yes stop_codon:yes gene_type:complete